MTPRKLNIMFSFFSYAGNSTGRAEHPDIRDWFVRTMLQLRDDERIGEVTWEDKADTPLHMVRNHMVEVAKERCADVLVSVDSDMQPDCELGQDHTAKPFFQSSFDFLYKHWDTGPVCIASPYCGAPDWSNVFAFQWAARNNLGTLNRPDLHLEAYGREHTELLDGIQEAAAGPTGLIMWDMRSFSDVLKPPYHYYEYTCPKQIEKASTEDVTITRDFSMGTQELYGYNGFFINWSAWSGHWKCHLVRKPRSIRLDHVNEAFRDAVKRRAESGDVLIRRSFLGNGNGRLVHGCHQ